MEIKKNTEMYVIYGAAALVLILIFMIVNYITVKSNYREAKKQVQEVQELNGNLLEEQERWAEVYEIAAIESCRDLTKEVMYHAAILDGLSKEKQDVCARIVNKPKDILDPYSYYKIEYNTDGSPMYVRLPQYVSTGGSDSATIPE